MKPKLYKSLLYSMVGAGMLSLGSCTDLSETIYNQIASEKYEFTEKDAASMFAPVYSSLRNFYWAWYGYADLDICTDMWVIPLRIGVGWVICISICMNIRFIPKSVISVGCGQTPIRE